MTKLKVKFNWQTVHEDAFQKLQSVFFKKPVLNFPNWKEHFIVNSDAFKTAISAVLMHKQGDLLLPISYFLQVLSDAERNIQLSSYNFVLYKGITSFKYYLFGRHFLVLSDAKPLQHYTNSSYAADIMTRWLMELSEYDFSFKHIPGKQNVLTKCLSRNAQPSIQDLTSHPDIV